MELQASAYATAFESAPDGMAIVDPDTGCIRECNPRFAALVDRERADLLDRDIRDLLAAPSPTDDGIDGALRGDGPTTTTWTLDAGSTTVVADVRLSPLEVGGDALALARVTDATERIERERELERRTRAMEEAPIGISISDPSREDNPLVYVNEGFQELTGYRDDEVVGRNCRFLQGDGTREEPVAELREAIDAEAPVVVELRNYRKDGSMFWNRVSIAPVRDDEGRLQNFVGFQMDVTQRKQYERELELARRLLETVPSGVLRTTPSGGTVEYANPALVDLLGATNVDELRDRRVADFYVNPEEREALVAALDEADGAVQREVKFETLGGDTIDVMITASRTRDESGDEHIQKVVQDITERKEYERKLKEQRDNLDVLNQILRHDIRNDLQLVTAYADFLEGHVDEEGTEYVEKIQRNATNAVELTRTARDMADVMLSTEANRQPVDLRNALEGELDDVRSEHPDAAITVEGAVPAATVRANEMLGSVFRNLLTNAIQHNDKDIPEVTVSVVEDGDGDGDGDGDEGTVTVRVADNGPGVPDDRKKSIFGKGEKGLESAGTGIGLYLVDTLVDRYGGDVWVEDNEPEGSVFVVELPLAEATDGVASGQPRE
ncbi:MAG: PAS domain S-box protein [Haloquadratum sp.]